MFTEEDKLVLQYKNDTGRTQMIADWIKTFPQKAINWEGKHDETLFHWCAITSLTNLKILTEIHPEGIYQVDRFGNTPFDWVINRLGIYVVMGEGNLSEDGKLFILNQSNEIAAYLYDKKVPSKFDVTDWLSKSGSIAYIHHLYKEEGVEPLLNIGENDKSIIHNWLLLGERLQKHQMMIEILEKLPIHIDSVDNLKRSALYYAIDGWVFKPEQQMFFEQAVKTLLRCGADPFLKSDITEELSYYEVEKETVEKDQAILLRKYPKTGQNSLIKLKNRENIANPIKENGNGLSPFQLSAYNKTIYEKFKILIEINEKMKGNEAFKEEMMAKEYGIYKDQLPNFFQAGRQSFRKKKKTKRKK